MLIAGCICNGRDALGLVNIPVADDPTLRPGDIVATNAGLMAYNGGPNGSTFTPISTYAGLSADLRRQLAETKIESATEKTATAEEADLFLPIAPGGDTALFCGLLVHLAEAHALDYRYIDAHTSGFEHTLARARNIAPDIAATARATGLASADVARFFQLFCASDRVVTCYSQGVNQSAQGTDKVNAIINCHLATGRIGRAGIGPFSLTGQPNAMGGREVGGLANQLAAHMTFKPDDIDRVARFWNAPRVAPREGLKAV